MGLNSKISRLTAMISGVLFCSQNILAQAISIHDCQGLLRQRTLVESGELNDVEIAISGVSEGSAVLMLRDLERGTQFVQETSGSQVVFHQVPAGNYMLFSQNTGVMLGSINVYGEGAAVFGGDTGLLVGGGAALVGTGFVVRNQIDKRDSGGDSNDPDPSASPDCDCDPNASPEPLSPDDFFRTMGSYRLSQEFSSRRTPPLSGRLWLGSLQRFWWNSATLDSSKTGVTPGSSLGLPLKLETSTGYRSEPVAFVSGTLATAPWGTQVLAAGAASTAQGSAIAWSGDETKIESLGYLQVRQALFPGLVLFGGSAVGQEERASSGAASSFRQNLLAMEASPNENSQLRLFATSLRTEASENFSSWGLMGSFLLRRNAQLQVLLRESNEEGQALEVFWSTLLP